MVVYFITGANRGIGLGIVTAILRSIPGSTVFATAREPAKAVELNFEVNSPPLLDQTHLTRTFS